MTDVCAVDLSRDVMTRDNAVRLRDKVRDLVHTILVYLAVAVLSGLSYAVCASAWNGSDLVRWWLAAILPIGIFIVGETIRIWVVRKFGHDKQLNLFHP